MNILLIFTLFTIPEILSLCLLGAIQGITEFLPISSTAHLLLFSKILYKTNAPEQLSVYLILIQIGTCLASIVYFKKDIKLLTLGLINKNPHGKYLLILLLTAMIPASLIGITFHSFNISTTSIITGILFGAIIILIAEKNYSSHTTKKQQLSELRLKDALLIGILQILSLMPGISRSLITIVGGYVCNCSRNLSVHFSFLLGMCMSGAACIYELLKYHSEIFRINSFNIVYAIFSSFIFGLISISWSLSFLKKHGLRLFALYRLLFACLFLYI